ncbi:MAG: sigma 54-interacting transcriptional regulator [Polyangiaceae bacterium]
MSDDLRKPPSGEDDLRTELSAAPASQRPTGAFSLLAIGGPCAGSTVTVSTPGRRMLIGQSEVCDLILPDRRVSRRHLALELAGDSLRVNDLGSTNGTFVAGIRVIDVLLRGGEDVVIGDTTLRVARVTAKLEASDVSPRASFGRVVGSSPAMRALYPLCERLAQTDVTVLIEGETGTGKEILAESIHEAGPRASGPFVVFDCTTVAPNLLESELFGHERGAFTGAAAARAGLFEQADGGTLLIDEIGDLEPTLQPKLLRAIERSEVRRVGGQRLLKFNVRVLTATRRDLDQEVQRGRFRDDLFHRIAVARIELPPLRARKGDIAVLARHFAQEAGASPSAIPYDQMLRWEDAPWPGNARELKNAVARYLALGDISAVAAPGDAPILPPSSAFEGLLGLPIARAREQLNDEFERVYIEHVLSVHGGDIAKAAAASGIARRQFFRLKARVAR